jgi:hypothetical protein
LIFVLSKNNRVARLNISYKTVLESKLSSTTPEKKEILQLKFNKNSLLAILNIKLKTQKI